MRSRPHEIVIESPSQITFSLQFACSEGAANFCIKTIVSLSNSHKSIKIRFWCVEDNNFWFRWYASYILEIASVVKHCCWMTNRHRSVCFWNKCNSHAWLRSFHDYDIINMNYLYPKQCVTLLIAEALVTIARKSVVVSFTIALVVVGQTLGSTALHSTKDN